MDNAVACVDRSESTTPIPSAENAVTRGVIPIVPQAEMTNTKSSGAALAYEVTDLVDTRDIVRCDTDDVALTQKENEGEPVKFINT